MNDRMCGCYNKPRKNEFELLKEEYDSIKTNMYKIKEMEVSDEAKKPIFEELEKQVNEVKEKMHNYIDTL